jgi:arylsulfatase
MIEPGRVSDGLFDFCDILPTFCAMAGVEELPQDRYIDGVDQRGFLLTGSMPQGTYWAKDPAWGSNRVAVYAYLLNEPSAVRFGPWKAMGCAIEMGPQLDTVTPGGFCGYTAHYTYGKTFNLFLDPKEEHSFMIRKLVYAPVFGLLESRQKKTFEKYPPRIQIAGAAGP